MTTEFSHPLPIVTATGRSLQLRLMQARDLERVTAIERQAHSHPWRRSSFETRLRQQNDCLVAADGDQVLAYAIVACNAGDAELLNIAVDPDSQRQGIARALLETLIDRVASRAENLFLEVRVSNLKAIDFYNSLGFVEVGCRRNYYPSEAGREDALLMARVL